MSEQRLLCLIGEIDDSYLDDVHADVRRDRRGVWLRWGTLAACVCLMVTALFIFWPWQDDTPDVGENVPPGPSEIALPTIGASSVQEFYQKCSQASVSIDSHPLLWAVGHETLRIDGWDIYGIWYARHQNENGTFDGRESIDMYWHEEACPECKAYKACLKQVVLYLICFPEGVDRETMMNRYKYQQLPDSQLYQKELVNNKTSYYFFVDDQYYFRFTIGNDNVDQQQIVACMERLGLEMRAYIQNQNN